MSEPQFCITDPEYYQKLLIEKYQELSGRTLYPADPERLLINVFIYGLGLMASHINETGKQNLLDYASGDNLDELGKLLGVVRLPAESASVTLRFTIQTAQSTDLVIPEGTSATPDGSLIFRTNSEAKIIAGNLYCDVIASCATAGVVGNGFIAGQINQLTSPAGWTVSNITTTSGGSDEESDETLRQRIRIAPEAFSNAGSVGAYTYWAKTAHPDISDVRISSPNPGDVLVIVLLKDGQLPSQEQLDSVSLILDQDKVRPLTDHVLVQPPSQVEYSIELSWYLHREYESMQGIIASEVIAAVNSYISWQKTVIGRDINPSYLINKLMSIDGIKRVSVSNPAYTALSASQVAKETTVTINYGGVEDE